MRWTGQRFVLFGCRVRRFWNVGQTVVPHFPWVPVAVSPTQQILDASQPQMQIAFRLASKFHTHLFVTNDAHASDCHVSLCANAQRLHQIPFVFVTVSVVQLNVAAHGQRIVHILLVLCRLANVNLTQTTPPAVSICAGSHMVVFRQHDPTFGPRANSLDAFDFTFHLALFEKKKKKKVENQQTTHSTTSKPCEWPTDTELDYCPA